MSCFLHTVYGCMYDVYIVYVAVRMSVSTVLGPAHSCGMYGVNKLHLHAQTP